MEINKKRILSIVIILYIIVSLSMLEDYRMTKTNHNHTTSGLIQVTKWSMTDFVKINANAKKDTPLKLKQPFREIYDNIRLLELSLRNATFTKDSIEKDSFYDFVLRLSDIVVIIESNDELLKDQGVIDNLIRLFGLFHKQNGYGTSKSGLVRESKVIIKYSSDTWQELERTLSIIEDQVLMEQKKLVSL